MLRTQVVVVEVGGHQLAEFYGTEAERLGLAIKIVDRLDAILDTEPCAVLLSVRPSCPEAFVDVMRFLRNVKGTSLSIMVATMDGEFGRAVKEAGVPVCPYKEIALEEFQRALSLKVA